MPRSLTTKSLAVLAISLCAGCATPDTAPKRAGLDKERTMLSEGYSLLHEEAGDFDRAKWILLVKKESESVHDVIAAASNLGDDVKKDLERIARDYPGVRIDLDPLPEMENRKRAAIAKDRAKYFAPVVGHGGREYERTVLIALANGLNHERHLCEVMAAAEPDAGLQKFLLDTEKRFSALNERVNALLEKEYFAH